MAKRIFFFIFCIFLLLTAVHTARADVTEDINNITKELDALKKDLQDKEANFQNLNKQLDDIRSRVVFVGAEIVRKFFLNSSKVSVISLL